MNYETMAKEEVIRLLNTKITVEDVEHLLQYYPNYETMSTKLDSNNLVFSRIIAICKNIYNVNHNDKTIIKIPAVNGTQTAALAPLAPTPEPETTTEAPAIQPVEPVATPSDEPQQVSTTKVAEPVVSEPATATEAPVSGS
ncbi:hypothetical protein [Gluconacetobacter diazotrophicus]|uniref:hypothetical protein n=1 Tax=Gluconacetobacter diazotrophicus TaxID=33996 RepID=UPI000173B412|nr:hypothetical protein [Gluconacetobacter diazotrophicus]